MKSPWFLEFHQESGEGEGNFLANGAGTGAAAADREQDQPSGNVLEEAVRPSQEGQRDLRLVRG